MRWLPDHKSRTRAVAAAVLLSGVVLAGCSDDDDGTSAGTASTTETDDAAAAAEGQASGQEQVAVDIVDIEQAYQPSSATVTAGGEVTWSNVDDIPHTVTAEDGTWDSGNLEPGADFSFTAEEPGTYDYVCSIHPSMQGQLVVE